MNKLLLVSIVFLAMMTPVHAACYLDGKAYTTGTKVEGYVCQPDGTWKRADQAISSFAPSWCPWVTCLSILMFKKTEDFPIHLLYGGNGRLIQTISKGMLRIKGIAVAHEESSGARRKRANHLTV
jgi:hypothetical protein